MGLDMYAFAIAEKNARGDFEIHTPEFEDPEDKWVLKYWRKHHDLHGWMEQLYREKGGEGEFNCQPVRLTLEDLDMLEKAVAENKLPPTTGFFFGNYPPNEESQAKDLDFIRKARAAISVDMVVYYDSWW